MAPPAAKAADSIDIGAALLRSGNAAAARAVFERLAAGGGAGTGADFTVFLGLGAACQALRDPTAAAAAADAALEFEPRDLRALLLKADALDALGDSLGAAAFYKASLDVAPPPENQPREMQALVARAQAGQQRVAALFQARLRAGIEAAATRSGPPTARFEQSLDLLVGRKQLYVQSPRLYYFPELPQVQFFPREAFDWLAPLEAAAAAIREELAAVMREPDAFAPYVQSDRTRPMLSQGGMRDNPQWGAFYLFKNGTPVADNAARCPRTMKALEQVPLARIPARSPNVLFSLMRPGAHIPAHHGFINTRLIVHLPLVVPPGCTFRVGNETREWVEGRAWLFDDTFEHEAWNHSEHTRVVLLFEVWRPELTALERAHVSTLFETVDSLRGTMGEWGI